MPAETRSLRQRLLGASLWSMGGMAANQVLRLGVNLVMTRLLLPEAFGVMALVLSMQMVLSLMSDAGLHQSVIRHARGNERVFLDTVWSVQIVRGGLLCALGLLLAGSLGVAQAMNLLPPDSAYNAAALPWALAVSSLGSLIHGMASTKVHTAVRDLNLRHWVTLELVQQVCMQALMVLLAWLTGSIWAIVAASLVGEILYTVLSHRYLPGPRNRLAWDREVLRDLMQFGKWVVLSSGVGALSMNGDRLLLGGVATADYMGLYSIAFGLAGALGMVFERMFASVLLPAFSEVARADESRMAQAVRKARWRVDPVMVFASGLLFATGPLVVEILYDGPFLRAGPILSVLAVSLLLSRYAMVQQVYMAIDRPQYPAVLNGVRLVSTFTLIPLGLALGGPVGGLWAIALRELPVLPFVLYFNARHRLNHFGLEAVWLLFWPLGWAAGWCANAAWTVMAA